MVSATARVLWTILDCASQKRNHGTHEREGEGFWRDFATSPGLGGTAAVVAAGIAFAAVSRQIAALRREGEANRKEVSRDRESREKAKLRDEWWARAQFGIEQLSAGDPAIGLEILDALTSSEYFSGMEADFLKKISTYVLEADEAEHGPSPQIIDTAAGTVDDGDIPRRQGRSWLWKTGLRRT
jgi:hypothetical protein